MDHIDLAFVYLMVGTQGSVLRKVTAAVVASSIDDGKHSDPFRRQFYPSRKCCIVYSRSGYSKIALVLLSKISYFLLVNY